MTHIFISHSTQDGGLIAQQLVMSLESAGHRCWVAPRDVRPGVPYPGQIVSAIRECDGIVLVVTPAANESPDVLQEVQIAGQHRKTVAPIIVNRTVPSDDLHYYLGVRHQIPWEDANSVVDQLLRTFSKRAGLSQSALATPPKPIEAVREKQVDPTVRQMQSVGLVRFGALRQPIATGFLLSGRNFAMSLADRVFFVTASHLRNTVTGYGQDRLFAYFEKIPEFGEVRLDDIAWISDSEGHDVVVFDVTTQCEGFRSTIELYEQHATAALYFPEDQHKPNAIYVIQHLHGGPLTKTGQGASLVDFERNRKVGDQRPLRMHYQAKTGPGASGAPVFDAQSMQLLAVHHRGGRNAKLNGASGFYDVKEGMCILPAIYSMRSDLGLDPQI